MKLARGGKVLAQSGEFLEVDLAIDGDRIAGLGPLQEEPSEIIDAEGLFLLPGLVDAHVHLTHFQGVDDVKQGTAALTAASRCLEALRAGVTSVRDTGSYRALDLELRTAIDSGIIAGPTMACAGEYIAMTGGHGSPRGRHVDGPDQVRRAAREQLASGADFLKMMCSGGVLLPGTADRVQFTEEEVRAAAEEAEAFGTYLAVHAHPAVAIKRAITAGARSIEHGSFLDDECIELMLETGTTLTPTFAVYRTAAASTSQQAG